MDDLRPDRPLTEDDDVREALDEAAEAARRPHHDEDERRHAQEGAEEAERSPRRGA